MLRPLLTLSRLLEQLLGGLGVDRNLTAALEAPDLKLDRWGFMVCYMLFLRVKVTGDAERLLEQLLGGLGVDRNLAAALEAPDIKLVRWV